MCAQIVFTIIFSGPSLSLKRFLIAFFSLHSLPSQGKRILTLY